MSVGTESRAPAGRLRELAAGPATPDRLRRVGAVLVVGCVLVGVVSLFAAISRTDAVRDGGGRVSALSADAAELFRSLADADAMATSGYVAGGVEPAAVRSRYDADLDSAGKRVVDAAGLVPAGDVAAVRIAAISRQLPIYSGLIETARVYNRQGLPLGQSYLDSGSKLMQGTILPTVQELRVLSAESLDGAYRRGGVIPLPVLLIGLGVLLGVIDAAVRERRRTNRVLNAGLLGAGAALVAVLLWWMIATLVAGQRLEATQTHSTAAAALDDARVAVLKARSNESLVLVARGGGSQDSTFTALLTDVLGNDGKLVAAERAGAQVAEIRSAAQAWQQAHQQVRQLDDGGDYAAAVRSATGADAAGSGPAFERLDAALGSAIDAQRNALDSAAAAANGALTGLAIGPTVLALLAAAGVVAGIGRRVGEYR